MHLQFLNRHLHFIPSKERQYATGASAKTRSIAPRQHMNGPLIATIRLISVIVSATLRASSSPFPPPPGPPRGPQWLPLVINLFDYPLLYYQRRRLRYRVRLNLCVFNSFSFDWFWGLHFRETGSKSLSQSGCSFRWRRNVRDERVCDTAAVHLRDGEIKKVSNLISVRTGCGKWRTAIEIYVYEFSCK